MKPNGAADEVKDIIGAGEDAEIVRLARLSLLDYERQRIPSSELLGCRASILDKLVSAARPNDPDAAGAGRPLDFVDIEPWPAPVEGAALLAELTSTIHRYIILGDDAVLAIALWVVFTHCFTAAICAPKLLITSPVKRCGKSRLLQMLSYLTPRAQLTANIKPAALFRVIERHCPTLLIDEADTFVAENDELKGLINSGFDKESAWVLCTVPVGDGWDVHKFPTWCPQVIAGIGRVADTITDRSFVIQMTRKLRNQSVTKLRRRDAGPLTEISRKVARWAADHIATIEGADPDMPTGLNDRACDAWETCLAIADAAGGQWPRSARRAAMALSGDGVVDSDDIRETLLADLWEVFEAAAPSPVLFTQEILNALSKREDRPWSEWKHGKPITGRQLAALLKPLGIATNNTYRRGPDIGKGYERKQFDDAFARYTSTQSVTRLQVAVSATLSDFSSVTPGENVTDRNPEKPSISAGCNRVTDPKPLFAENVETPPRTGGAPGRKRIIL